MPLLHVPTLLTASGALLALSALGLTLYGRTQHVYRGWAAWAGATWAAAAGLALLLAAPGALALAGQCTLLVWPTVALYGLRRFHRRAPMPGEVWSDALLLGLAMVFAAACAAVGGPLRVAGFALAGALLYAQAGAHVWACRARRDSRALRLLAAVLLATAAAHAAIAAATGLGAGVGPQAAGLLAVPAALLMALLALQFTHERAQRELRESRRRLRFFAHIDTLTRVPNRRRFAELARRALALDSAPASLLLFDIDHFKTINDAHGHAAGDRALRLVARCMRDTLRAPDVAGRLGGDEFVLLLPRTTVADAMAVAARIVERVQRLADGHAIPPLTLSFGVVQAQRREPVDAMLHRADLALYEAKRQGRSRAVAACAAAGSEAVFSQSKRLGLTPS